MTDSIQPNTYLNGKRYRVLEMLSEGGMGAVYLAEEPAKHRLVAIKVATIGTPEARDQFQREAGYLLKLKHHGLPRIWDTFGDTQRDFLVMEYIPGQDLQARVDVEGPQEEWQVLTWADELLDALDHLHSQDPPIIHRDVKPANLKVRQNGELVLVDFGIAKEFVPGQPTIATAAAVSPGYSPPEQYDGDPIGQTDARSDVYSAGATLYFLLTGKPPPPAPSRASGAAKLRSPRQRMPDLSARTDSLVVRALTMEIDGRWPGAAAMRAEVKAALDLLPGGSPDAPPAQPTAPPPSPNPDATLITPRPEATQVKPKAEPPPADRPSAGADLVWEEKPAFDWLQGSIPASSDAEQLPPPPPWDEWTLPPHPSASTYRRRKRSRYPSPSRKPAEAPPRLGRVLSVVLLPLLLLLAGLATLFVLRALGQAGDPPQPTPTVAGDAGSPFQETVESIRVTPTAQAAPGPAETGQPLTTPLPTLDDSRPVDTIYTVQKGDTLPQIALRFGVSWEEIAAANGLQAPEYRIVNGQALAIPGARRLAAAVAAAAPSPTPTRPPATATPVRPKPTATPSLLVVVLTQPAPDAAGRGGQTFAWTIAAGGLAPGQAFELIFWKEGEDPLTAGFGLAAPTQDTQVRVNLDDLDALEGYPLEPGAYLWGLRVLEMPAGARVGLAGQPRRFVFDRSGQSG